MGQIDTAVAALGSTAKAFWKLAEASGATSCADTVGSHPLTPAAGITLGSTGVLSGGGDSATAANANGGSTGYLSSTWTSGAIPTTVTVFMVVNPNSSVPALHETGLALYASSGTRFGMYVKRNSSPYYMATWNSSGSQWLECNVTNGIIARSTVTTLAWTHTGTQVKFYVNGALEATKTSNALASTYTQVLVGGSQPTGSDPYRGNVAAVLLADPLTDAQISALHAAATTVTSDTTPPTVPTGLAVDSIDIFGGAISWTASTDDTAVTGYQVAVDGSPVGTTASTSYTVTGLNPGTSHTVAVRAYDAAGNYSSYTSTVALNTPALSGPITSVMGSGTILVSHRGGQALYPAETMTAYQQAANDTPIVLEGDTHLAVADGTYATEFDRMVLLHSPTMSDDGLLESDGVTLTSRSIWTTTVSDFLTLKMPWPTSGTPASTARWSDLFSWLVTNSQACLIEPKHSAAQTAILNAARTKVGGQYLAEYLLHNSFTYDQCVEAAAAGMVTQWITSSLATHSAADCAAAGFHSIAFQAGTSGWATLVSDAHAAGIKAYVWTITSQAQADTYLAGGVDGIISDDPTITVTSEAAGALTITGAATASGAGSAAGSFGVAGVATAAGSSAAAGTVSLTGSASAQGSASSDGVLTITGSATASSTGSASADGAMSITGAATAAGQTSGAGALAVSGSASAQGSTSAAGALTLTGLAVAGGGASASAAGVLSLVGAATAQASAQAAGALALAGTATATGGAQAAGLLALSGAAGAQGQTSAAGAFGITGASLASAQATVTGMLSITGMALVGTITGHVRTSVPPNTYTAAIRRQRPSQAVPTNTYTVRIPRRGRG